MIYQAMVSAEIPFSMSSTLSLIMLMTLPQIHPGSDPTLWPSSTRLSHPSMSLLHWSST